MAFSSKYAGTWEDDKTGTSIAEVNAYEQTVHDHACPTSCGKYAFQLERLPSTRMPLVLLLEPYVSQYVFGSVICVCDPYEAQICAPTLLR